MPDTEHILIQSLPTFLWPLRVRIRTTFHPSVSEGTLSFTNPPANSRFRTLATGIITTRIYLCRLNPPTLLPTSPLQPFGPKVHPSCRFITGLVPSRRFMGPISRQMSRIVPFPSILTISMILETPAGLDLRSSTQVCITTLSLMQNNLNHSQGRPMYPQILKCSPMSLRRNVVEVTNVKIQLVSM